ncbi:hypothetical protein V1264_016847 [Littorina saxatilis]|uniref:Uncharacterized protein n=1 Tax=Littorina saxatilis TaxID=31220 RepID=A0AAN9BG00_9CAEN
MALRGRLGVKQTKQKNKHGRLQQRERQVTVEYGPVFSQPWVIPYQFEPLRCQNAGEARPQGTVRNRASLIGNTKWCQCSNSKRNLNSNVWKTWMRR